MGVTPLIATVHEYINIIMLDPELSEKAFLVSGYAPNSVKEFIDDTKQELHIRKHDQEKLGALIKLLETNPAVIEIKRAYNSPMTGELYKSMPSMPEPLVKRPNSAKRKGSAKRRKSLSEEEFWNEFLYTGNTRPPAGQRWGGGRSRKYRERRSRRRVRR